jgi:hypothetical protein
MYNLRLPIEEHEAGHAVVLFALGIEVENVIIGDMTGKVTPGVAFRDAVGGEVVAPENARHAALFALGGKMYEVMQADPTNPDPRVFLDSREVALARMFDDRQQGRMPDDVGAFYFYLDKMGTVATSRTIEEYQSSVLKLLRQNKRSAGALADDLKRRGWGLMSGADARAIWEPHGVPWVENA